jgi:hypothetical protein
MATAYKSHGVKLEIGDGAGSEAFNEIPGLIDLNWDGVSMKAIDTTSHGDTWESAIASGLKRTGNVTATFEMNQANAYQQQVLTDLSAGTVRNFRLLLTDGASTPTRWDFALVITKKGGYKMPIEDKIIWEFEGKVTGTVTETAAT